jgi:hypothetical protein
MDWPKQCWFLSTADSPTVLSGEDKGPAEALRACWSEARERVGASGLDALHDMFSSPAAVAHVLGACTQKDLRGDEGEVLPMVWALPVMAANLRKGVWMDEASYWENCVRGAVLALHAESARGGTPVLLRRIWRPLWKRTERDPHLLGAFVQQWSDLLLAHDCGCDSDEDFQQMMSAACPTEVLVRGALLTASREATWWEGRCRLGSLFGARHAPEGVLMSLLTDPRLFRSDLTRGKELVVTGAALAALGVQPREQAICGCCGRAVVAGRHARADLSTVFSRVLRVWNTEFAGDSPEFRALSGAVLQVIGAMPITEHVAEGGIASHFGDVMHAVTARLHGVDRGRRAAGMRVAEALSRVLLPSTPLSFSPDDPPNDPGTEAWRHRCLEGVQFRGEGRLPSSRPAPVGVCCWKHKHRAEPEADVVVPRGAEVRRRAFLDPDVPAAAVMIRKLFSLRGGPTRESSIPLSMLDSLFVPAGLHPVPPSVLQRLVSLPVSASRPPPLRRYLVPAGEECSFSTDVRQLLERAQLGRTVATQRSSPPPTYLRDAVEALRSQSTSADEFQSALEAIPRLVTSSRGDSRHELEETVAGACNACLGLEDRFHLPGFHLARADALLNLVVHCPARAVPTLAFVVFAPEQSMGARLDAVACLADAAVYLSGNAAPRSAPVSRDGVPKTRRKSEGFKLSRSSPLVSSRSDRFGPLAKLFLDPLLAGLEDSRRPVVTRGRAGVTDPWGEDSLLLVQLLRAIGSMVHCARLSPQRATLCVRAWHACKFSLAHRDAAVRAAGAGIAAAVALSDNIGDAPASSSPARSEPGWVSLVRIREEVPVTSSELADTARELVGWAASASATDTSPAVRAHAAAIASVLAESLAPQAPSD